MSGVKIELINWSEKARSAEVALLAISLLLLLLAQSGDDWVSGANDKGKMVRVGLGTAVEEGQAAPWVLDDMCELASLSESNTSSSVACALAAAGGGVASAGSLATGAALVLGLTYVLDALAQRGLLAPLAAKLPPELPYDRAVTYVPLGCWALMLLGDFGAMLLFAARAPPSLGGGYTRLGSSYGLMRIALLAQLAGLTVHLSLVHRLGEDAMVASLDALRGAWSPLVRRQRAIVLLLAFGLLCEVLLWVRRAEYGALVLCYGLWGFFSHAHDHLATFCLLCLFSLGTDALTLANEDGLRGGLVPLAQWLLLISKLAASAMLVYYKDAFA